MRVYVNNTDAIFRAIKELGLKRDDSKGGLDVDEYITPTGSKVTFFLDSNSGFKQNGYRENDIVYWRSDE